MIVDRINQYLSTEGKEVSQAILEEVSQLAAASFAGKFGKRESFEQKNPWMSSIGKCMRQQAYKLLKFPEDGKTIDSRALMVFFMGDMAEIAIIQLAKTAGCEITADGKAQERIEYCGVTGRADGVLWEKEAAYLVEAKSMSSFSFKEFERGIIDEAYRYQINAGMAALKLSAAVVVGLNKDAGVLAEKTFTRDEAIVKNIEGRAAVLKTVTKETLPERGYTPNEKTGFYPWQCLYCAYHRICLPEAEKVVVSGKYKLKMKKETPNVPTTPAKT